MNSANALRYLACQAARCRDRDSAEALCLLFPAILRALDMRPMDAARDPDEIKFFEFDFKQTLEKRLATEAHRRELRTLETVTAP